MSGLSSSIIVQKTQHCCLPYGGIVYIHCIGHASVAVAIVYAVNEYSGA